VLLAGNRPSYSIAVFVEELRQPGRISNTVARIATYLDEIGTTIGKPREVTHDEIAVHIRKRRPLPLLAWKDIDEVTLARWSENPRSFRGVDVYVEPVRVYPGAPIAGHTIGYVGRRDWDETDTPYHYYLPDIKGRAGIERTLDDRLSGKAGGRLVRVDASGFKYDEQVEIDPVPGEDVMLTIDVRIQSVVEDVLRGERGACVVMSPQNGDVLAIASAPAFDTTVLRSAARYKAAMQDPIRPAARLSRSWRLQLWRRGWQRPKRLLTVLAITLLVKPISTAGARLVTVHWICAVHWSNLAIRTL
jgi:penicillin-binding protein 2